MSPVFCAVANMPISAPVRRAKLATSGVACSTASMPLQHAVGLRQRRAFRGPVVDRRSRLRPSPAGSPSRGGDEEQHTQRRHGQGRHDRSPPRTAERPPQQPVVALRQPIQRARWPVVRRRRNRRCRPGMNSSAYPSDSRTAAGEGQRQRGEELPDYSLQQPQRHEYDHGGERRADHRGQQLLRAPLGRDGHRLRRPTGAGGCSPGPRSRHR